MFPSLNFRFKLAIATNSNFDFKKSFKKIFLKKFLAKSKKSSARFYLASKMFRFCSNWYKIQNGQRIQAGGHSWKSAFWYKSKTIYVVVIKSQLDANISILKRWWCMKGVVVSSNNRLIFSCHTCQFSCMRPDFFFVQNQKPDHIV